MPLCSFRNELVRHRFPRRSLVLPRERRKLNYLQALPPTTTISCAHDRPTTPSNTPPPGSPPTRTSATPLAATPNSCSSTPSVSPRQPLADPDRAAHTRAAASLRRRHRPPPSPRAHPIHHRHPGVLRPRLRVTPAVLIPRPETEHLVEAVLERLPHDQPPSPSPTSAPAREPSPSRSPPIFPRPESPLLDISPSALAVAQANAHSHGLEGASFLLSDLLEALPADQQTERTSTPSSATPPMSPPPKPPPSTPRSASTNRPPRSSPGRRSGHLPPADSRGRTGAQARGPARPRDRLRPTRQA